MVDSLGAASPHGQALPLFLVAFVLVLTSLRVLIAWIYTRTGSLLLAQCTHASSTGFLVMLGAAHVTSAQEALWYAIYGALLGVVAAALWSRLPPRCHSAYAVTPGSSCGTRPERAVDQIEARLGGAIGGGQEPAG